jgi:uncharacterized RDD family membrane protein YckC
MREFLLSPFPRRLRVCAISSLILVAGFLAFATATAWPDWKKASDYRARWSGIEDRCRVLFGKAEIEFRALDMRSCAGIDDFGKWLDCDAANREIESRAFSPVVKAGCSVSLSPIGSSGAKVPSLDIPSDLGNPLSFALESWRIESPEIPAAFAAILILLLAASDAIGRLLSEANAGWKRLNAVASSIAGTGMAGHVLDDGGHLAAAAGAGLLAFAGVGLAIIYGRAVFLWVAEGFAKHGSRPIEQHHETPTPAAPSASAPAELVAIPAHIEAPAKAEAAIEWKPAAYWPRFWARCLDLPLCWVLGGIPGALIPDIRSAIGGPFGIVLDALAGMVVICLAIFCYEAFFVSRFGATPGKMLFGLRVRSVENRDPTWAESRMRGWSYLKSGLYFTFFLPVIQILGAVMAWRRRDESQPWDMAGRTHVVRKPIGVLRFAFAVILSFLLVSGMVVSHKMLKEGTKEDIRRSVLH